MRWSTPNEETPTANAAWPTITDASSAARQTRASKGPSGGVGVPGGSEPPGDDTVPGGSEPSRDDAVPGGFDSESPEDDAVSGESGPPEDDAEVNSASWGSGTGIN